MILMIDNQDSFTYNLIDYIKVQTTEEVKIISVNDLMTQHLDALNPRAIVISPGPGKPSDYPILSSVLEIFFGGNIIHNDKPIHGHITKIRHSNEGIFKGLPSYFNVMRYHSLMADPLQYLAH